MFKNAFILPVLFYRRVRSAVKKMLRMDSLKNTPRPYSNGSMICF